MSDPAATMTFATALFLLRRAGLKVEDAALESLAAQLHDCSEQSAALAAAEKLAVALDTGGGFRAGLGRAFPSMKVQVVSGDRHEHVRALRRARFGSSLPMLAPIVDKHEGGVAIRWAIVLDVDEEVHLLDPNPWDDIAEERHMPIDDFAVRWELAESVLITF